MRKIILSGLAVLVILVGFVLVLPGAVSEADEAARALPAPEYAGGFWRHWGDGRAELAAYDLVVSRYGESRQGTAVSIVVSERFRSDQRVKSDSQSEGTYPVLKLNFVRDFPTGVYDYNLMTSAFVALEPVHGLVAGTPTKISFSAQEWCGHAYQQALFGSDGVEYELHSYFEGEADRAANLQLPSRGAAGSTSEDVLWLWARGLTYPYVAPGDSATVPLLGSLETARLRHQELDWLNADLSRSKEIETVEVPAGRFEVDRATAVLTSPEGSKRTWTYWTETAFPHRVIAWEGSAGERGELIGSDRLAYWKMNGKGFNEAVEALGLVPRPSRTM